MMCMWTNSPRFLVKPGILNYSTKIDLHLRRSRFIELHMESWKCEKFAHTHTRHLLSSIPNSLSRFGVSGYAEWKTTFDGTKEGKVQALAEVVFQGIARTLVWHQLRHQQFADIMLKRQYCRVHLKIRGLQIHWFPTWSFTMIIAWDATSNGHPSFSKRHRVQFCSGKVGSNFSGRGRKTCTLENQQGTWTGIGPPLQKSTCSSYTGRHVHNRFLTAPYT